LREDCGGMTEYLLEILPSGITESPKSLRENLKLLGDDVSRVRYIVASEVRSRVFDKSLGIFWLFLEPIIITGLYYLLTVVIFQSSTERHQFLFIMVAVIFWRWFSRTIDASPTAVLSYAGVLKQTNFSIRSVIFSYVGTECVFWGMNFIILMIFLTFFKVYPTLAFVYLPFVVLTEFFFIFLLTLIFSVIGTFFKDLVGFLYAFTAIWWYLSPGIYPISRIPQRFLWIYMLNPFAHILPAYRDVLINGTAPRLMPLTVILAISCLLSLVGLRLYGKFRYHFFAYL
jgi:ABC-type polysaccharide/polyol phosphate export permease